MIAVMVFCSPAIALSDDAPLSAKLERGQQIYAEACAQCHGDSAEGVEGVYEAALEGDLPVAELAKYVDETMPEDAPDDCAGEDAHLVSSYLHHAFYSREARLKNNPPTIDFSRRTVAQFQNSVSDIMKELKWEGEPHAQQRGLTAKYFATRKLGEGDPAVEKLEGQIDFDFGEEAPYPDVLKDKEQFSASFKGGLIAEETGVYEFFVTSQNGFRLSINRAEFTIDNNVNSTDQTEFTATVKLIGGRPYPISLTMFKFNEKFANIKLEWIPPGGVRQVIPQGNLTPGYFSMALVLNTEFPADDSSVGYPRGTNVSQLWDSATTAAAIEAMAFVEANLKEMMSQTVGKEKRKNRKRKKKEKYGDGDEADKEQDKGNDKQTEIESETENGKRLSDEEQEIKRLETQRNRHVNFAHKFVEIAFGRELTESERQAFVQSQFEKESSPIVALKRVILLTLKSPQFLYMTQFDERALSMEESRQSAIGSTLATVLWDSIPDKFLREAIKKGTFKDRKSIEDWAWDMLDRPRTHQKLNDFLHHWLELEKANHASKDVEVYPGFDQGLIYALRTSLSLSLEDILWSEKSDFRELFLFDELYVDQRMSEFYGIKIDEGATFVKTGFETDRRCGILTHPCLMTGLAYFKNTSPIHRGVFIAKSLLGRTLKAPPIDVEPLGEDFDPSMTTRERVAHQTKEVNCSGCHSVINPLGFSLENFDAVGRFRESEKDKPINSETVYITPGAEEITFTGAKDLANYLVNSPEAHRSFIEKLFEHFVKQPVYAFGPDTLDDLYESFVSSNYNVKQLIVKISVVAASSHLPAQTASSEK